MQYGQCHHVGHNGASYDLPHLLLPSQSGYLHEEDQTITTPKGMKKYSLPLLCYYYASLTNTNLNVIPIGGVFEVVNGAHHVQGHVTDVMCMIFCLLWCSSNNHVGISNSLYLQRVT